MVYTHAMWRVDGDRVDEFIEAWEELSRVFAGLPRPPVGEGTLLQSSTDPALFYSFGPWASEADVQAMREDAGARRALEEVRRSCSEATPGLYRVVR